MSTHRPFAGLVYDDAPGLCFTTTKERQHWEQRRTKSQKRPQRKNR